MHCRRVQRFIFLFAEGQIARGLESAFRSHLAVCPRCLRELEAAERLVALARCGCRRQEAPEHLRLRLTALIAGRCTEPTEESDE